MNKKNVLKKNHEFQKIIKSKQFIKNSSFVIYYKNNNSNIRFGISVGKKIGIAVKRNLIKRQIRMICQQVLKENIIKEKKDILIIVRKKFLDNNFAENNLCLKTLLKKVKLKTNKP